jgi:NOL1/NOP2/fmu family ribosome biogenesis protein
VFIVTKDITRIDLKKLIIDRVGLYFAELRKKHVRLSKEGAQLLVLDALQHKKKIKNLVELEAEEVKQYFLGLDLEKDLGIEDKPIIISYKNNILGCAQYKEGKILNFLPKIHRGEVIL